VGNRGKIVPFKRGQPHQGKFKKGTESDPGFLIFRGIGKMKKKQSVPLRKKRIAGLVPYQRGSTERGQRTAGFKKEKDIVGSPYH